MNERLLYVRTIYTTKKSATSATFDCNILNHNTLWVHLVVWKMLLEILLAGVNCYLHIRVLLCRNETYRKVGLDFSV